MNQIPARQNEEPQLRLLRARKRILDDASAWLMIQFGLTVVMPMGLTLLGLALPQIRPWAAAAALGVTLIDVLILDRMQRHRIRLSAKIAEAFDEAVLEVPWNALVGGKRAPYPEIAAAERRWARWGGTDERLRDWYPVAAGRPPLHLGRIICQRTNLWYDGELRRHYGRWLIGLGLGLPLTRLIKYLRDIKTRFVCSSVLLTTLLAQQIDEADKDSKAFADVPTALQTVMGRLDDWLQARPTKPAVCNPFLAQGEAAEDFAADWTQVQYDNFRASIHRYRGWIDEAVNAIDRDNSVGACERRPFGIGRQGQRRTRGLD